MKIYSAKQVGTLYYMVKDLSQLYSILKNKSIWMSSNYEYNKATDKNQRSVSFSRNPDALHAQKPEKYRVGVILDGNQLSESNKFVPYSHSGTLMEDLKQSKNRMKLRSITSYDDGTYGIAFQGWGIQKPIDESTFKEIEILILEYVKNDPVNSQKERFEHSTGKTKVNGRKIVDKYFFNTSGGSNHIDFSKLSNHSKSVLSKAYGMNQYEERIWGPESKSAQGRKKKSKEIEQEIVNEEVSVPIEKALEGIVLMPEYSEAIETDEINDKIDEDQFQLLQKIDEMMIELVGENYKIYTLRG